MFNFRRGGDSLKYEANSEYIKYCVYMRQLYDLTWISTVTVISLHVINDILIVINEDICVLKYKKHLFRFIIINICCHNHTAHNWYIFPFLSFKCIIQESQINLNTGSEKMKLFCDVILHFCFQPIAPPMSKVEEWYIMRAILPSCP